MINILRLYCGKQAKSDQLRYTRRADLGPVVAYNCTNTCNLRCVHCYSNAGKKTDELDTDQVKNLLAQLKIAGCPVVLLSGGEPLLRNDILEIAGFAQGIGLTVAISTNGTLIDRRLADKLAALSVRYVGISIDGPADANDRFRGVPGSFAHAIEGIESCKAAGLRVGLRFTITVHNWRYIGFVFDLARQMGIRRLCFYHLVRCGRATAADAPNPALTRSIVDTIIELTSRYADYLDEVLTVGNHADGPYLIMRMIREGNPLHQDALTCLRRAGGNRSGLGIACIGPDGSVYADQFWRNYSLGNVLQRPFAQIWYDQTNPLLRLIRNHEGFADPRCQCCRWFDICKGNYRFLGPDPDRSNWLNEPACYLNDGEVSCQRPPSCTCEASRA